MKMRLLVLATGMMLAIGATSASAVDAPEAYTKRCELCHSVAGQGGKMKQKGGSLDGVGTKRNEAWLRAYIADPKSQVPTSKMMKVKLSPEEMNSIVQYLLTLK